MNIVIDTHSLLWYFTADKKLKESAKHIVDNSLTIFIPLISLLELFYLLNKRRKLNDFYSIFNSIKVNDRFELVSLDLKTTEKVFVLSSKIEMHDAIIIATADLLSLPLVTKDRKIREIYENTIW